MQVSSNTQLGICVLEVALCLSQQLLDKEAEAAAIEDTIYFLRKAYERTAGDPRMNATDADRALSSYLFEVRKLAKQQFMALALKQKIAQRRGQTGL